MVPGAIIRLPDKFYFKPFEGTDLDQCMKKDDVAKLWSYTGARLHKGNIRNLLKQKSPVLSRFPEIVKWRDRLRKLLNNHYVMNHDRNVFYTCYGNMYSRAAKPSGVISFSNEPNL